MDRAGGRPAQTVAAGGAVATGGRPDTTPDRGSVTRSTSAGCHASGFSKRIRPSESAAGGRPVVRGQGHPEVVGDCFPSRFLYAVASRWDSADGFANCSNWLGPATVWTCLGADLNRRGARDASGAIVGFPGRIRVRPTSPSVLPQTNHQLDCAADDGSIENPIRAPGTSGPGVGRHRRENPEPKEEAAGQDVFVNRLVRCLLQPKGLEGPGSGPRGGDVDRVWTPWSRVWKPAVGRSRNSPDVAVITRRCPVAEGTSRTVRSW
jgi:hypothetical protein